MTVDEHLGRGKLHDDEPAHAQAHLGRAGDALAIQQVTHVGGELRHRYRARRDRAVPVATQVGGDDTESVTKGGQLGRPHAAIEGMTVDEHHDRTVADVIVSEVDGIHGPMVTARRRGGRR